MNILKEKLVSAPILVYLDWNKQFHVHIHASGIALGIVLVQPGKGDLDHPIYFEFTFEVIIKLGELNVGPDHLSRLESRESGVSLYDQLPDTDLFYIEEIPDYLEEITTFLARGKCSEGHMMMQKRDMVVLVDDYQLIARHLYKLGLDQVLW
eukprot:PITA_04862